MKKLVLGSILSLSIALPAIMPLYAHAQAPQASSQSNTAMTSADAQRLEIAGVQLDEPKIKHIIKNGIGIRFTPMGQELFKTKLIRFIQNFGVDIQEGYFETMTFGQDAEAKPLSSYVDSPESKAQIEKTLKLMSDWLTGFSWPLVKPVGEVADIEYQAQFKKFSLATDTDLLNKLGKRTGAVLTIEVELQKLKIATKYIRLKDEAEGFGKILGTIGVDNFTINAGTQKTPLRMKMPFFVDITPDGQMKFEAISFENNLSAAPVSIRYDELHFPKITILVNDKAFPINETPARKLLEQNTPGGVEKLKVMINELATKKLPDFLNKKAADVLKGKLEEITKMSAPGPTPAINVPFLRGLQLSKISLNNSLNLSLNFFVEDPLHPATRLMSDSFASAPAKFTHMNENNYDVGISLDRAIINRVLQLYFYRGAFEKIQLTESTLKLIDRPVLSYMTRSTSGDVMAKLRVAFEAPKGSVKDAIAKKAIKENFRAAVDVFLKLRKKADTQELEIAIVGIDPNSLVINEDDLRLLGKIFKQKVYQTARKVIAEHDAKMRASEVLLDYPIAVPTDLQGVKMEIENLDFEKSGQLVVYLKYSEKWRK